MAASPATPGEPIHSVDALADEMRRWCKPRSAFRIGIESERFGVDATTLQPLPFEGPNGVQSLLVSLGAQGDWAEVRERSDGPLIGLRNGQASITLEPAGQFELAGSPLADIHAAHAEMAEYRAAFEAISAPRGIAWLSIGFHPFARHEDLPHVPKLRYPIMERYLPTRGPRALDMMRRTCTVQANVDYASEADAMRTLRLALAVQPVVTAMFANSPVVEGRLTERASERAATWIGMDPDRSGLLPFAWKDGASFADYVQWALDVPMFMIRRGDEALDATHLTFRGFLAEGLAGHHATMSDWETHLNTLFPEVRLKRTIELRGADAPPPALSCAVAALWKGVLYDDAALDGLEAMVGEWEPHMVQAVRPDIAERALRATLADHPVQHWAEALLDLAAAGLARHAVRNANGHDESVYLEGIRALVARGQTPSDVLRARIQTEGDLKRAVMAHATPAAAV